MTDFSAKGKVSRITQMTHGLWKGPLTHSKGTDLVITSEPEKSLSDKSSNKLPPVFAWLDKAEALAYVSRLFDAAAAGAVLWGDKLLLKRFLEQCSRTGSQETKDGYRRELRHFVRWRDQKEPSTPAPSGTRPCAGG